MLGWGQTYDVSTLAGGTWRDGPALEAKFCAPYGSAIDRAGNVIIADASNNRIRKISPDGVVTTLAGLGNFNYTDGTGTGASFYNPTGVAVDGAGNVYVADQGNDRIRKISPAGVVTTLAGSGIPRFADGTGTAASFNGPTWVAVDGGGNVYVADHDNNCIRKINPAGVVTTLAGSGIGTHGDGIGTAAAFYGPEGVAVDSAGNVYVADGDNNRIRKISPTGLVTTLAGWGAGSFADGTGISAFFYHPTGVAVDRAGNVYVADQNNHRIRKISPARVVTTLAGSGIDQFADGTGTAASFNNPCGVAVDRSGNVYVADQLNHRIRKISPSRVVTTFAGLGTEDFADGRGTAASFNYPRGVTVDGTGNVYVADCQNHRIRKIDSAGIVTTLAGSGTLAFADGTGSAAGFSFPTDVAVDGTGNVYVADCGNHRIRKINSVGVVTTLAGSGIGRFADGTGTAASFWNPSGVAIDSAGNVYVADQNNHRIRKISPAGIVTTLAGSGIDGFVDSTGTAASFNSPLDVALDGAGQLYVADAGNHRIRKLSPAGVVTTLAGRTSGYADGTGTAASFASPSGVAVDGAGNVYVADYRNLRIRKISPADLVITMAGSGPNGSVNGAATVASFNGPTAVAVDGAGIVYFAEECNHTIRKLTPSCTTPSTPTISGTHNFCQGSYTQLTSSSTNGNLWSNGDTTRIINVNSSGSYSVKVISGACTSAVSDTFRIVVNQPSNSSISQAICQGSSFVFDGIARTTSGTYNDTLTNAFGCDSMVSLNLTVNPLPTPILPATIPSAKAALPNLPQVLHQATFGATGILREVLMLPLLEATV